MNQPYQTSGDTSKETTFDLPNFIFLQGTIHKVRHVILTNFLPPSSCRNLSQILDPGP